MIQARGFFLVSTSLFAILMLSGCASSNSEQGNRQVAGQKTGMRTVVVSKVTSQKLSRDVRLPADLVAYRDVAIYPKVPGFIEWIGVDRGSDVKKGELLIRMTAPELSAQTKQGVDSAQAARDEGTQAKEELDVVKEQLVAAEAKSKASADTYHRLKEASSYPGIIAGNDLEIAQKNAEADAASVNSLERKCKSLESQEQAAMNRHKAALQAAKSNKSVESYLHLDAPFDGVITERNVHEGSFVHPPTDTTGMPLLRVKQLSVLRLVVPVPEMDVGGVVPGASVGFTVSAYPGESFTGVIRRIGDSVDVNTRTMAVELDVVNQDRRLTPGMFAEVVWPVRRNRPTLFVLQSAVIKTTEQTFVIRVKNGLTEWVDVKPGFSIDEMVEVFGDLHAGDQVAARGTDELRAGMQVSTEQAPPIKAGS